MNHRAPRRAFALRRAGGPGGRRVAPRRAARPRLRLAAAAGCALVSTSATLVSANELRQNLDGVFGVTLRGDATTEGAAAAWAAHDAESPPVGWSARSHTVDPRTPARTARAPASGPPGSPAPTEGSVQSPAASYPSAESRRLDRTEAADDTDETTGTPKPSDSTPPDQGGTEGTSGTVDPQQPADDGADGSGRDGGQRPGDDSGADPGGEPGKGQPPDDAGQHGDPENDGAGQSDSGQDNPGHSDADHKRANRGNEGQGGRKQSGAHGPKTRQNMTGDASQTAPTSGPATPTSWMETAFTRALSWAP